MVQKILGAALAAVLVGSLAVPAMAHPAMPADSHVKERTGALTGNSYGAESCSLKPAAPVTAAEAADDADFVARTITAWGIDRSNPADDAADYAKAVAVYNISLGDKPVEPERLPKPGDDADQAAQTAYDDDQDAYTNRTGKYGAYDTDIANWNIAVSAPAINAWREACRKAGYELHDERETVAACPDGERYSQRASGGELTSRCTEIISVSNAPEDREIRAGRVAVVNQLLRRVPFATVDAPYYRCDTDYGGDGYTGSVGSGWESRCLRAGGGSWVSVDAATAQKVWPALVR